MINLSISILAFSLQLARESFNSSSSQNFSAETSKWCPDFNLLSLSFSHYSSNSFSYCLWSFPLSHYASLFSFQTWASSALFCWSHLSIRSSSCITSHVSRTLFLSNSSPRGTVFPMAPSSSCFRWCHLLAIFICLSCLVYTVSHNTKMNGITEMLIIRSL